ncbi:hypothetical protein C8R44DRAFT_754815 [Mycena epipterygia]|nr:hypothetical protein C8R44DRAFT_754815 [Mycena epipterygia]
MYGFARLFRRKSSATVATAGPASGDSMLHPGGSLLQMFARAKPYRSYSSGLQKTKQRGAVEPEIFFPRYKTENEVELAWPFRQLARDVGPLNDVKIIAPKGRRSAYVKIHAPL